MFPHQSLPKYTWNSSHENTHNQTDHILLDRRRHSKTLDVRSLNGAESDTDHCVVVAKIREKLAEREQAAQNFDV